MGTTTQTKGLASHPTWHLYWLSENAPFPLFGRLLLAERLLVICGGALCWLALGLRGGSTALGLDHTQAAVLQSLLWTTWFVFKIMDQKAQ